MQTSETPAAPYEPPTVMTLGSLVELTRSKGGIKLDAHKGSSEDPIGS